PRSNKYSYYEVAVNPPDGQTLYPVINYSVSRNSAFVALFDEIGLANFGTGLDFEENYTTYTHRDQYGSLIIHEAPTTAIEFNAEVDNSLEITLSRDTGALKSGNAVIVGNEDVSGTFILQGDASATILGRSLTFEVGEGGRVIFRANPEGEAAIGQAISEGVVGAEMFISDDGYNLLEDIVVFDELTLQTIAADPEIDLKISGDLAGGKVVVVHVDKEILKFDSPDDIGVKIDDQYIEKGAGLSETLYEDGADHVYFITENEFGYDVVIYLSHFSEHMITIGSAEQEIGIDGYATFLSALAMVGIAAVALIYNKD
ncbi:MAG: hypothetical protein KAS67_00760, partial [Thermoplasmata archaeon]|nr:hypothetical protein [Thermoplasmata archaeon]